MKQIIDNIKVVVKNSKNVKIEYKKLKEFAKQLKSKEFKHWLEESPFDISKLNSYQRLHFLLVLNSISFCYWSVNKEKWTVKYKGEEHGGAKGMILCLKRAIEEGIPILNAYYLKDIKEKDLEYILRGNIQIPLFKERLKILRELGRVLVEKYNGNFENFIESSELKVHVMLDKLITNFSYFNDTSYYLNKKIYFNKRAQLLLSDIHNNHTILKDPYNLTACADYKLPQVFRHLGIFRYSKELEEKINRKIPLEKDSQEEIEIRANTIWVVYELSKITGIEQRKINDYLWLMAQDISLKLEKKTKYHRVKTINY